jgi:hypothetical protein
MCRWIVDYGRNRVLKKKLGFRANNFTQNDFSNRL